MRPGHELDTLIAEKVMGQVVHRNPKGGWSLGPPDYWDDHGCAELFNPLPDYSTDIAAAWEVVQKLAPICGDFQEADGFFHLTYAESACHEIGREGNGCDPGPVVSAEDEVDTTRWSAHFHPGHPGADTESERIFPDYRKSCARGETAPHAICLAALKVVGIEP